MSFLALCRQVGLKDLVSNVTAYPTSGEASGGLTMLFKRWATKKTAGSTKNGRDSHPKFLGVKKFGGEKVIPGNIIVRQRGTRFHPGEYVGMGKDHTLYALKEGHVRFERHKLSGRKWVHVNPSEGHVLHPIYQSTAASDASEYLDKPSKEASHKYYSAGRCVPLGAERQISDFLQFKPVQALNYFGIRLRPGKPKILDHDSLIEKVKDRINSWGARFLLFAGRSGNSCGASFGVAPLPAQTFITSHGTDLLTIGPRWARHQRFTFWSIGNGVKINTLTDRWVGNWPIATFVSNQLPDSVDGMLNNDFS